MTTVKDIFDFLNGFAPVETQESYDNVGVLFGSGSQKVDRVLLALDATSDVIDEAAEEGAQLIVTHHPVIFGGFKNVRPENATGKKLISLAKKDLCVISMHTNLDKAEGGVNDSLVRALGAKTYRSSDIEPFMRVADLPEPLPLADFLAGVKKGLNAKGLRYYNAGKPVSRFACAGGAGGDCLEAARMEGCDTLVTADIKYSIFLDAMELGMNLIDADHFCTENPVIPDLKKRLEARFQNETFIVSKRHHQVIDFF